MVSLMPERHHGENQLVGHKVQYQGSEGVIDRAGGHMTHDSIQ